MIVEAARRAFSALSDVTIGTAIVLVHLTIAERQRSRLRHEHEDQRSGVRPRNTRVHDKD
jgi:hypothetical protein